MTPPKQKEYITRDKPAERNIVITNILLAILTLGGGVFGTVVTNAMGDIQSTVKTLSSAMTSIRVTSGITVNDIQHIKRGLEDCKEFHAVVEHRLDELEYNTPNGRK